MLIAAFTHYFFGITIFLMSLFLILLVLVQRGRGGGLTGALGGPGGQSAFGTKAGDLFTKITIGVAAAWILLCVAAVMALKTRALPTFAPEGTSNSMANGSGDSGASESSGSSLGDLLNDEDTVGTPGLGATSGLGAGAQPSPDAGGPDLSPSTNAEVTDLPEGDDATAPTEGGTPEGSGDGDAAAGETNPAESSESTGGSEEPSVSSESTSSEEPGGESSEQ